MGDLPPLSATDRARLSAQVDDFLKGPYDDDDATDLLDAIIATGVPGAARPAARIERSEPIPEPDWAADHVPAPMPIQPDNSSALFGGSGSVHLPHINPANRAAEPEPAETPQWQWKSPEPPPLNVPEDVADIAPVIDDPVPAPTIQPPSAAPAPTQRPDVPKASGKLTRYWTKARQWWSALSRRGKIVVCMVAALTLVIGQQISHSQSGQHDSPSVDGPAPTVVTQTAEATGPTERELQPGCPPGSAAGCLPVTASSCSGGSSDPSLAFGTDPSQAWICARAHGIDLEQITILFPRPVVVTDVFVIPGYAFVEDNGLDRWLEHRIATAINWRIGGQQFWQDIPSNAKQGATKKIPAVATQIITATVMKSAPPPGSGGEGPFGGGLGAPDKTKVNDSIAISRIKVLGYPAGGS
ncbi:hypothetical protein B5P44_00275 [Mycobacterium sp. CBMA 213]|uniref:Uncharacterized protein n=2 Tax=Mycolicibacterium TaxID=1866885 RepID=A0A343VR32_9MYCO|nr:hypothetical protein [Mycolicibacterium sp. CBMA 213]AVN58356.1 hypothetical protein B5P44_p00061 [Mycolicibacterium sp. CBMA 213]MUM03258.1 hypothetical protein [Mycolicibacterium sp. CBMA 213]